MVLSCGHQSPLNLLLTYNSGQQSSSFFGGWGGEFQIRELDKHLPPQLFSRQLEGAVQVLPAGLCFTCAASASTSHALLLPLLHMRCFCLCFTCAASASASLALLLLLLVPLRLSPPLRLLLRLSLLVLVLLFLPGSTRLRIGGLQQSKLPSAMKKSLDTISRSSTRVDNCCTPVSPEFSDRNIRALLAQIPIAASTSTEGHATIHTKLLRKLEPGRASE